MKNISKTDKKILNEFEINYLVLLLVLIFNEIKFFIYITIKY